MTICSSYFGVFDLRDREVVNFRSGLPGFEEQTQYAALSIPGQEPILYLQSIRRPELCFITLPARVFFPDYHLDLSADDREALGLTVGSELRIGSTVACQVIVTVDRDHKATVNLGAPLVINLSNYLGIQVYQAGSEYSFRHPIDEMQQSVAC